MVARCRFLLFSPIFYRKWKCFKIQFLQKFRLEKLLLYKYSKYISRSLRSRLWWCPTFVISALFLEINLLVLDT